MIGKIAVTVTFTMDVNTEHYNCETLEEVGAAINADLEAGNYGIDELLADGSYDEISAVPVKRDGEIDD